MSEGALIAYQPKSGTAFSFFIYKLSKVPRFQKGYERQGGQRGKQSSADPSEDATPPILVA
ncbi:hypothetical protein CBOM_06437 [Ceraceosorus bombacis]|uniref:Uncharacterized protein n=1 Tax=Ceraceosorus bombacis TaxID=401625 RepID=A0A0P1BJC5_9BASI|nr:hypothetical protein CBOM_06437 [Ceraceosorus bombacis]